MPYIPDSVFESGVWKDLSGLESRVYAVLCQHYNKTERMAFPGQTRIAAICGTDRGNVSRAIDALCKKGLVVKRLKDNPNGKPFNFYLLPDFLLYEYKQMEKELVKYSAKDVMGLTNLILGCFKSASVKTTLPSVKTTTNRVKTTLAGVSKQHPNYIINYITNNNNFVNSFNNSSKQKIEKQIEEPVINDQDFISKLRLHGLKLGGKRHLSETEIEEIIPRLSRDESFNIEEKESVKIGLRSGVIGKSI